MGKEKYLKKVSELFNKSPVVSYSSIEKVIKTENKRSNYAKKLVGYLTKNGKIKKLAKGYYTSKEDISLAVFCFKPSYLGLQDALSFHNLWEQETIPVIITSKKVRQGIKKVMNKNIFIRRINKKYLFGFDYYKSNEFYLPYSDIEKTFIDMIYFKEKLSEVAIKNIKERINKKNLNKYLREYPKRIRKIVFSLLSSY